MERVFAARVKIPTRDASLRSRRGRPRTYEPPTDLQITIWHNNRDSASMAAPRGLRSQRIFPAGRIRGESEPPNLATETNAIRCPLSARSSPSPVRIRLRPSLKPRESAGVSGMVTVGGRKVSATADWVAVRAVDREPVSESQFFDLQGKYREFTRNRLQGGPDCSVRPLLGVLRGVFR